MVTKQHKIVAIKFKNFLKCVNERAAYQNNLKRN